MCQDKYNQMQLKLKYKNAGSANNENVASFV